MNFCKILLYYCIFLPTLVLNHYNALVINPVVDLTGEPINIIHNHNPFIKTYRDIPLCGKSNDYTCPRIAQLLKNDMVTILEQRGTEVLVQVPHLFYESFTSSAQHKNYWSEKKNFITFDQLAKTNIDLSLFPLPVGQDNTSKNIVTLKLPYKDPLTTFIYAAGTRFVCQKKMDDTFIVHVYNPLQNSMILMPIAQEYCLYNQHTKNHHEQQKDFIALLKLWIQQQGIVPYVWGGSSLMAWHKNDVFNSVEKKHNEKIFTYYQRPQCTTYPHYGFDCSGLVLRAAQICGIPFHFKNTTTIAKYLHPITAANDIHDGDIIWIPGHVMIISSVNENKLIEARHYFDDYGKVHEIDLKLVFKNVSTYRQLFEAIKTKTPLERLSKNGNVTKEFDQLKLLKFASVWSTHNS